MESDTIFDSMVLKTVVGEDMEEAARLSLKYLMARDKEERELGFRQPAMVFLSGVDQAELDALEGD